MFIPAAKMEDKAPEQPEITNKRRIEDIDVEEEQPKKAKRNFEKEMLEEITNCDEILKLTSLSTITKMSTLTAFLDSLIKYNVNIMQLKDDFPTWVKTCVISILNEIKETSVEFFVFLTSALRVTPTIFEPISDRVLRTAVFFPRQTEEVHISYIKFMKQLASMFEKLRRFPKLIAKLLCCVRDYIMIKSTGTNGFEGCIEDRKPLPALSDLLPKEFMESIGPIVSLLPSGQIVDLWNTLHHNLDEECIKKIANETDDDGARSFLPIVTELYIVFLTNIKVVDYSVPLTTLQRVTELMIKLPDECLEKLGSAVLQRKHDPELVKPFLKLAYTWAELHGLLLFYNGKYKLEAVAPIVQENPAPTNLAYLHPYLKPESWIKLGTRIENDGDSPCLTLWVILVAQKLKYMAALQRKSLDVLNSSTVSTEEQNKSQLDILQLQQENLKATARFLWSQQGHLVTLTSESMEIFTLAAQYMDSKEMIQLAGNFVKRLQAGGIEDNAGGFSGSDGTYYNLIDSADNQEFHCALVVESLGEIMTRLAKMKMLKKYMKNIVCHILSVENRALIVPVNEKRELYNEVEQKSIVAGLLDAVNELIEEKCGVMKTSSKKKVELIEDHEEFSSGLILDMLKFLSELSLEDYPKIVKTVVFLSSLSILIAVIQQPNKHVIDLVASIVSQCGSSSQGNEIIFAVKWTKVFKWFCANINSFSAKVQHELCVVILGNIYISPKSVTDFENEFNLLCESFEMTTSMGLVGLITFEFLIQELQSGKGAKTKLTPQLQNHTRKLTHFVVKSLQNASENENGKSEMSNIYSVEGNIYRSCWLCIMSLKVISESSSDFSAFKPIAAIRIQAALSFLSADTDEIGIEDDNIIKSARTFAIKFLRSVCTSKEEFKGEVPDKFILKLWSICLKQETCRNSDTKTEKSIIPKFLLKDIYEAASNDEFEAISSSIIADTRMQSNAKESDEIKMELVARVLDELVDAGLVLDKKEIRRKTVEECLHAYLLCTTHWKPSERCLLNVVLPYIRFQMKLLRRRTPMGSVSSLAVCLTSVTAVPLDAIQDIALYRKVFYTSADLLNAFAIHRLDVISFRTPIFLQCFLFLVESLVTRADQKNKLTDGEIFDLRYCAHSIERICQSAKSGQKEFSRISPYFVAVLMKQFEIFTVYPAVKHPLLNGCYKLLDLCDEHGIAQLNSMLTIGSREIFKTVYDMYKKFYRYKGKV